MAAFLAAIGPQKKKYWQPFNHISVVRFLDICALAHRTSWWRAFHGVPLALKGGLLSLEKFLPACFLRVGGI
jgi:hypothetical protein